MVIWIIGKSGVGKTFFSRLLYNKLKEKVKKVAWIDGDKFRNKFSKDLGYSLNDRRKNSKRIQKFCKQLEKKNKIVICSVLSIFKNHQKENKKLYKNYFQIYIKANQKLLEKRNSKKIYNLKKNVVGKDINFPYPYKSNIILKNNFDKSFLKNLNIIVNKIYKNFKNSL